MLQQKYTFRFEKSKLLSSNLHKFFTNRDITNLDWLHFLKKTNYYNENLGYKAIFTIV